MTDHFTQRSYYLEIFCLTSCSFCDNGRNNISVRVRKQHKSFIGAPFVIFKPGSPSSMNTLKSTCTLHTQAKLTQKSQHSVYQYMIQLLFGPMSHEGMSLNPFYCEVFQKFN